MAISPDGKGRAHRHSRSPHKIRSSKIASDTNKHRHSEETIIGIQAAINDLGDQMQLSIRALQARGSQPTASAAPTRANAMPKICGDCGAAHNGPCRFMVHGAFDMESYARYIRTGPQPEKRLAMTLNEQWPRSQRFKNATRQEVNRLRELVSAK